MLSDKKLWEIALEAYRRMYAEADPPADIDEIIASGEGQTEGWFNKYFLEQDRQREILIALFKEYPRLTKRDKRSIEIGVFLGASPRCVRP